MPAERFNHVHVYQEDPFCAQLWYRQHLNAAWLAKLRQERVKIVTEPYTVCNTRAVFIERPSVEALELVEVAP